MEEHHITVPRTARYHTLGDAGSARAVWIVLHGYGQLARYFLRKFEGLGKDMLVVAPEGLSRYYLDDAHSRAGAMWMTREDRANEIEDQVTYLDALAVELLRTTGEVPLNVLGFSQGVATARRWSLQGRTTINRLVLWAGGVPLEPTPEQLQPWNRMDLHLVLGTQDEYAGDKEFQQQIDRLNRAKVQYQAHRFHGGHELEKVLLAKLLSA